jgi:aminoglycoside phosphotransferase (APT) family kinase protein
MIEIDQVLSFHVHTGGSTSFMTVGEETDPLELIDRTALETFLAPLVPAYDDMSISLLAGGASNLTYLLSLDDRRFVLRRRPLGSSAPKAHDMSREFRVLDALQGRGLPIPRVYGFHEAPDVVGAPCYLMDFLDGLVIHGPGDAKALAAQEAAETSRSLIETLGRLHAIGPDDIQLSNFGSPDGFLARRIASWLRQWTSVDHRHFPQVEAIGRTLQDSVPVQLEATLVHGDYRLGNVILDPDDASVAAVLDWEMSTIGDPLTDLAHLLVYWCPTRGRVTHPAQLISRQDGFFSADELVSGYAEETGRDVAELPFYLAFEHWRAAIIKDAIYLRRVAAQTAPDPETETFGASIALHLEEAADILAELGLGVVSAKHRT